MNNEDIGKEPTCQLINEMSYLETKINLLIMKYDLIRLELIKRFPKIEESEEFKEKWKVK